MKTVFPIILTPADVGYVVTIPDLNINTEGSSVADAIEMARDAIGLWGICEEDAGREIPKASTDTPPHKSDEIVTLVDIDFSAYRRAHDLRTIRKNVKFLHGLISSQKMPASTSLRFFKKASNKN